MQSGRPLKQEPTEMISDSLNVAVRVLLGVEDVNIGFCQRLNSTPRQQTPPAIDPRTQNQSRPASIRFAVTRNATTAASRSRSSCSA